MRTHVVLLSPAVPLLGQYSDVSSRLTKWVEHERVQRQISHISIALMDQGRVGDLHASERIDLRRIHIRSDIRDAADSPWHVARIVWEATPPGMRFFAAGPSNAPRRNQGCAVVQMPGVYDEMPDRSHPDHPGGTDSQRWHRDLLRLYRIENTTLAMDEGR